MKLRTVRIEEWIEVEWEGQVAKFLVHPLTPKETSQLLEKAKVTEWENGQRFVDTDLYKFKINKVREVIIDWENVTDENDEPLKCNDKTKEAVYLGNPDFIDKVLAKANELYRMSQEKREQEPKNL